MTETPDERPDLARAITLSSEGQPIELSSAQIVEALADLPENRRELITSVLVSEFHSGPLPSPRALAGYEVVAPGLAREIVDMAVRQQIHDQSLQNRVLDSESSYRILTLVGAVVIILGFAAGAVVLGAYGQTAAAVAMGSASGLTLVAGAFLKGRDLLLPGEQPKNTGSATKLPTATKPRQNRKPRRRS